MNSRPYPTPPPDGGIAKLYRQDRRRAARLNAAERLAVKLLIVAVMPPVVLAIVATIWPVQPW